MAGQFAAAARRLTRFPNLELRRSRRVFGSTHTAQRRLRPQVTGATNLDEDKMGDAVYDRLEKDVSKVKNDIATLTDHITDAVNALADAAKGQARRGYRQARANVDSAMDDFSDRSGAMMEAAQDAALDLEERFEGVVAERPLATVGLALGLGFLIGLSWRR